MEKKQTALQIISENIEEAKRWSETDMDYVITLSNLKGIIFNQLQIEEEMIKEFAENFAVQMGGALNSRNDIDDYFKANFKSE